MNSATMPNTLLFYGVYCFNLLCFSLTLYFVFIVFLLDITCKILPSAKQPFTQQRHVTKPCQSFSIVRWGIAKADVLNTSLARHFLLKLLLCCPCLNSRPIFEKKAMAKVPVGVKVAGKNEFQGESVGQVNGYIFVFLPSTLVSCKPSFTKRQDCYMLLWCNV